MFAEVIAIDLWPMTGLALVGLLAFAVVHVGGLCLALYLFSRAVTRVFAPLADQLGQLARAVANLGTDVKIMSSRIEAIERLTERSQER
jgi:hypothetical protein